MEWEDYRMEDELWREQCRRDQERESNEGYYVLTYYVLKLDLFTKLDFCRSHLSSHLSTMPSGNITFPARKETMGRTVEERDKFLKSVQGQGPKPKLTFTHHPSNRDL